MGDLFCTPEYYLLSFQVLPLCRTNRAFRKLRNRWILRRLDLVRCRLFRASRPSILGLYDLAFLSSGSVVPPTGLVEKEL